MLADGLENPGRPWAIIVVALLSLALHAAGFAALSAAGSGEARPGDRAPQAVMVSLVSLPGPPGPSPAASATPAGDMPGPAAPPPAIAPVAPAPLPPAPQAPPPAIKAVALAKIPKLPAEPPKAPVVPPKPEPMPEAVKTAEVEAPEAAAESAPEAAQASAGEGEASPAALSGEAAPASLAGHDGGRGAGPGLGDGPLLASLGVAGYGGLNPRGLPIVRDAELIEDAEPIYPLRAKRLGIEGKGEVEVVVSPEGYVTEAHVLWARPANLFEKNVLAAARKWRFPVYRVDGRPAEYVTTREFFFSRN